MAGSFWTGPTGRRLLGVALVLAVAVAGYLASLVIYPAPIITRDIRVPLVVGLPLAEAEKALAAQGFRARPAEARETDPTLPAGHVVWQEPPAAMAMPEGSLVTLVVSDGPAAVTVPDVLQFSLEDARPVIAAAGLAAGAVDSVPSAADPGVVVATRPAAGTPLAPGTAVGLVVSRGPADVRVPDLTGLTEEEARRRIELAGLTVGLVQVRPRGRERPGTILEQSPTRGVLVPRGTRVDLTVAERRP